MGLSRATICFLIEEAQRRPFEGTLLTLGVQNVFLTRQAFEDTARRMGAELQPVPDDLAQKPLVAGTVTSEHVFRRLGFDRVVTTDYDTFEGCDFTVDLNAPEVPEAHREAYDMVLDAGTLEHVFHLPNALANVSAFTRPGGRVVHLSPSSNHIDHGFYMFSPTLFQDYYTANGFDLPRLDLFRYASTVEDGSPTLFGAYQPGALAKQMFGGLGGGCYAIAVVAEKNRPTDGPVIPQQGMYARAWADKTPPGLEEPVTPPRSDPFKVFRKAVIRQFPAEWRLRRKSVRRRFPLPVRRRF